jgi:hypothetical protein
MIAKKATFSAMCMLLVLAGNAYGFRSCDIPDSHAWSAATRYTVAELDFDETTGLVTGTETIYNYSNHFSDGHGECHVTYELSGSYVPGVEVFLVDGRRTNYSDSCPGELLSVEFPPAVLHSMQMEYDDGGSAVVKTADSGEFLAHGSWEPGKATYKTGEVCTIF